MNNNDEDLKKRPRLRNDIVISRAARSEKTTWVVKDPINEAFFRFDEEEWKVIKYFDGKHTHAQMADAYNSENIDAEIDVETIKDYQDNLESMDLLQKSMLETNVMLVEKMKEMRSSQILSKKGSLLYKRFPIVDPDKFFNSIIGKISWIWSVPCFIFCCLVMLGSCIIIFSNWQEFNEGVYNLFSFKEMSPWNAVALWFVIYGAIALHELGHGLTCKYYGGEVHEIGFLFLFFQPCMYCNVNDAWLFDKKWKQIMVTIAGGYVEFFIGSIFAFIWALTAPHTFINQIAFQTMAVCSVSTVLFNFNPLMKLDGYYLLSDYLEVPNLKENSLKYLKFLVAKHIFRMPQEEELEDEFLMATKRERKILFTYGCCSFVYMFFLLTGLVAMIHGLVIEKAPITGFMFTLFVAHKMLGSYVTSSFKFLVNWVIRYKTKLSETRNKRMIYGALAALIAFLVFPSNYTIKGTVTLEASKTSSLRAQTDGVITKFHKKDGEGVKKGETIISMDNKVVKVDRDIAFYNYEKAKAKLRRGIAQKEDTVPSLRKELRSKLLELKGRIKEKDSLNIKFSNSSQESSILDCGNQLEKINTYVKKGDEICRVLETSQLKVKIKVEESQVQFLKLNNDVKFKLASKALDTYNGKVIKIEQLSEPDPRNPKNKLFIAEILLNNTDSLRPGMDGIAKIMAEKMMNIKILVLKIAYALRMDLFF